jgi:hypothetical protein
MCLGRMREEGVFPHGRTLQRPAYCVRLNVTKDAGACSYLASYGNPTRSSYSVQEPYTLVPRQPSADASSPTLPLTNKLKGWLICCRGGSWNKYATAVGVTSRSTTGPRDIDLYSGFRLVVAAHLAE